MKLLEVVKAQYEGDYKIHLWFNNNVDKTIDLKDKLIGPTFEPLRDKDYFQRFHIAFNTIEWDNGADFTPEYCPIKIISLPLQQIKSGINYPT